MLIELHNNLFSSQLLPLADVSIWDLVKIFGIVLAGYCLYQFIKHYRDVARKCSVERWARENGYDFDPGPDMELASLYSIVDQLQIGEDRYAINVVQGKHHGRQFHFFDFDAVALVYDSDGTYSRNEYHLSALGIQLPASFNEELTIRPEGFLDKVFKSSGRQDIDFESREFSSAFVIQSTSKKFAYAVVTQQMMEFLLQHRKTSFEIEGPVIAFTEKGRMDLKDVPPLLSFAVDLIDRLPEYLVDDARQTHDYGAAE